MRNLLALSLMLFSYCSYGQSSDLCDFDALQRSKSTMNFCKSTKSAYDFYSCSVNLFKKLSSDVCSTELKIIYNNIAELNKQLVYLSDPKNDKFISAKQFSEKSEKITNLIDKQFEDADTFQYEKVKRSEKEYYLTKSNRNIDTSMLVLGAVPQVNNANSSFKTYILNGRMINCMTTGNLTSCN